MKGGTFFAKYLTNIYKFNQKRREKLLSLAQNEKTPQKKLEFVAKYFLNSLPVEIIAEIDEVSADKVKPFLFRILYLPSKVIPPNIPEL